MVRRHPCRLGRLDNDEAYLDTCAYRVETRIQRAIDRMVEEQL